MEHYMVKAGYTMVKSATYAMVKFTKVHFRVVYLKTSGSHLRPADPSIYATVKAFFTSVKT